MGQFDSKVDRQRKLLLAEDWAKGVKCIHAHSMSSLWYDTRGNDGKVVDVEYNDGVVERTISSSGKLVYFGQALKGDDLIDKWEQYESERQRS
jgi:hypothetical protein|tara:strand:+ start:1731 stop:2009 length:279 start_codon:yes stop_codon:yes gene_type:complete